MSVSFSKEFSEETVSRQRPEQLSTEQASPQRRLTKRYKTTNLILK